MPYILDEGSPLFAGLNVLPKKSTLTEYSARVATGQLDDLMDLWHTQAAKKLSVSSGSLDLDFHTIPYHGTTMEKHFVSSRRQRGVLALVARDASQRALIYASAKASQNNAVITFVDIWKERTGKLPDELVFDSRFTTYPFMEQLNERGILLLTLHKRFARLLEEISQQSPEAWKKVYLSNIGCQYRTPNVLEARIRIKAYEGELRQLAVRGLGHIKPTILLTNNTQTGSAALIDRYARRMLVENAIEEFINFFHMDALSAAVPLNIDVDLQLTLIGSALYRMLANRLPPPYAKNKARTLFRNFVDVPTRIKITPDQIIVRRKRRTHNSLLREAGYVGSQGSIPWMDNREFVLDYL